MSEKGMKYYIEDFTVYPIMADYAEGKNASFNERILYHIRKKALEVS